MEFLQTIITEVPFMSYFFFIIIFLGKSSMKELGFVILAISINDFVGIQILYFTFYIPFYAPPIITIKV